jgi:RecA-family ATPase
MIEIENKQESKIWISAKELLNSKIKKNEWLVESIIAEKGIVLFGGEPASFKSYLALIIAVYGANDMKILDAFNTSKFRTLIIDEENRLPRLKERLRKIMNGSKIKNEDSEVYFMANQGFKFDQLKDAQEKQLSEILREIKPDLIILDSMVRMMVGDENNSKDVRKIFDNIKSLSLTHNCAWLLLHHTRKSLGSKTGSDLRGSGDFMAMADEVIMLNRRSRNEFILSKEKCRDGDEIQNIKFIVDNTDNEGIRIDPVFEEEKPEKALTKTEDYCNQVLKWAEENNKDSFKTNEVRDALKRVPYDSLTMTLKQLVIKKKLNQPIRSIYNVVK